MEAGCHKGGGQRACPREAGGAEGSRKRRRLAALQPPPLVFLRRHGLMQSCCIRDWMREGRGADKLVRIQGECDDSERRQRLRGDREILEVDIQHLNNTVVEESVQPVTAEFGSICTRRMMIITAFQSAGYLRRGDNRSKDYQYRHHLHLSWSQHSC